jgi:glycosyltransferase involved in cell wall biosynthesis
MVVSGDYTHDPRVLREKETLEEMGHVVVVLGYTNIVKNKIGRIIQIILSWILIPMRTRHLIFDVVHCHDFDTLPAGVLIKKLRHCGLVYDAHEMYAWMTGISKLQNWEQKCLQYVDKIIAANIGIYQYLSTMTKKKIVIIKNCKDLISYEYDPPTDPFVVLYIGSLSPQRMFPDIVDYIGETGLLFAIAGRKTDVCYEEVKRRSKRYNNVLFLGQIPAEDVIERTKEASVVVCMFDPDNLNCRYGTPNKLYEALVCGRPIVGTQNTFLGAMIDQFHCGVSVPYNKKELQETLLSLAENKNKLIEYGKAGLQKAISEYNWEKEKKFMLEIYKCTS